MQTPTPEEQMAALAITPYDDYRTKAIAQITKGNDARAGAWATLALAAKLAEMVELVKVIPVP